LQFHEALPTEPKFSTGQNRSRTIEVSLDSEVRPLCITFLSAASASIKARRALSASFNASAFLELCSLPSNAWIRVNGLVRKSRPLQIIDAPPDFNGKFDIA
jgi:hypothetical protein